MSAENPDFVSNDLNTYGLYDLQELNNQEVNLYTSNFKTVSMLKCFYLFQSEIKHNYNQILKPLAQFAPYIYEDATFNNFKKKIIKDGKQ